MIVAIVGGLSAFLLFNLRESKNKIFLGDAGSTVLGLWVAYFAIEASQSNYLSNMLPSSIIAWILAIPIYETTSLAIYRVYIGRSPLSADRLHLHHILLNKGLISR